jgi:two-component system NarL family response regulator
MTIHRRITVMVVDDHPALRQGIIRMLRFEPDMDVVAEATHGRQAVALWPNHRPDVTLVDLMMPLMDGVETLERIRRIDPRARVLIFSSSESAADAARAEQAGACGYVTKEADAAAIVAAIREARAGGRHIRCGRLVGDPAAEIVQLTPREADVLALLRTGASNADIGRRLSISGVTVKTHIRGLMAKLDAPDRTAVVARAFDLGLLKAAPPERR